MILNIKGTGIDVTPTLKAYAEKKFGAMTKYFKDIKEADIDIGTRSHHHRKGQIYYAEVNADVPGKLVRVVEEADDLYKAIDKTKNALKVEFDKIKGKKMNRDREGLRGQKEYRV